MKEEFKSIYINGEESIYMISNKGRCINTKREKFLKPHKITRQNKVLIPIDPENCYYEFALYHGKKYYHRTIGRLVAEYFIPIPKKYLDMGLTMNDLEADHINEYRPDNRVKNLQWLTKEENYRKMLNSGHFRVATGSKHGNCKLTDFQLETVGQLLEDNKLTQNEISKVTGVPTNTINEIRAKRRFVYLSEKYNFENYNCFEKRSIDEKTIRKIMQLLQDSELPMSKIASEMKVSKSLVKDIFKGRCHKDIAKEYDFTKRKNRYKK